MKLRNIYVICRDNYDSIKHINGQNVTIANRTEIKVSGWDDARNALIRLREVASFMDEADSLIEAVPGLYRNSGTFSVNNDEWNRISSAKSTLIRTMDDTMNLYEKMGMDNEERSGIDIKLPKFNDFSEFVKYLDDIEFVLTKCPFLQDKDEKIEFENVDIGSTWLTFFIAGGVATAGASVLLNNIAAFIDKCIIIRSHFLTTQKQKLELEDEKRDENEKKIISKYIDDSYKKVVDAAIKELEEVTKYPVKNEDGDEIGRIKQCFEKMGILIDKGLQIRASIDSPNETKVLFEPLEMKYLSISENLKLIEANENSEE